MEKINKFLESKKVQNGIIVLGLFIIVLVIFQAGILVGFRKAEFSNRWGESYRETFGGKRGDMFGKIMPFPDPYSTSHGVVGKIITLELPNIVVTGSDGVEKVVVLGSDTQIMRMRDTLKAGDLKVDDNIIVIGSPDSSSQIDAKLIRVVPGDVMFIQTGVSTATSTH